MCSTNRKRILQLRLADNKFTLRNPRCGTGQMELRVFVLRDRCAQSPSRHLQLSRCWKALNATDRVHVRASNDRKLVDTSSCVSVRGACKALWSERLMWTTPNRSARWRVMTSALLSCRITLHRPSLPCGNAASWGLVMDPERVHEHQSLQRHVAYVSFLPQQAT